MSCHTLMTCYEIVCPVSLRLEGRAASLRLAGPRLAFSAGTEELTRLGKRRWQAGSLQKDTGQECQAGLRPGGYGAD